LQVIQGLRRQNPQAGEGQLAELLVDELIDDRELLLGVGRDLVRKALTPAKGKPKLSLKTAETARRQRVARQEVERQAVKVAAARVRETILLDLTMPNGISMRYCTGTQMAGFGTAYAKIAERVGDAMVGEVMVESEVKALLDATPT
jgi:hypothetical protein